MSHYLPLDAWHLILRVLRQHSPKVIGPFIVFFVVYAIVGRLRTGRLMDSLLLAAIMTSILIFLVACVYLLVTGPGYRFL